MGSGDEGFEARRYCGQVKALWWRGLGVLTALVMVAAGCGGSGGGDEVSCVLSPGNDKYCSG